MDGVTTPGLVWGIKRSFVEYIARMPDGQATVSGGAMPTETNDMLFEPDTVEPQLPDGADALYAFRGDVRFGGHFGMLYVRIADPWVTVYGDRGVLTILDPYDPDGAPRKRLVTFRVSEPRSAGSVQVWQAPEVILTPEACPVFNDVYAAGERFEPLTFAVSAVSKASRI